MRIEEVGIETIGEGRVELRARCEGQDLFYRVPEHKFCPQAIGDALLLSTLVPAMFHGTKLHIPQDYPVSSTLAGNLAKIQRTCRTWNSRLNPVELEAAYYNPESVKSGTGTGLFYSGGVDSSFSLIDHMDDVDTLIIAYGFDFVLSEDEAAESFERNGYFAERLGKSLVRVDTNHSHFVTQLGVSRTFLFGAMLAAIAQLLGLEVCYIAPSHSAANIRPQGSHPAVDPLFSNGMTKIIHDDVSVSRFAKTAALSKHPDVLANLRVCWEEHNRNCGTCSKCVRTNIALRLSGVAGPFPPLPDVKMIRSVGAGVEAEYLVELIEVAHARGDKDLFRTLKVCLRRHDRKEAVRYLDQAFLGGRLQKLYRRISKSDEGLLKVNLRPDLDLH